MPSILPQKRTLQDSQDDGNDNTNPAASPMNNSSFFNDEDREPGPDAQLQMDIDGAGGGEQVVDPDKMDEDGPDTGLGDSTMADDSLLQNEHGQTPGQAELDLQSSAAALASAEFLPPHILAKALLIPREKSSRTKKDSLKKREIKAAAATAGSSAVTMGSPSVAPDSRRSTPDVREREREKEGREKDKEKDKEKQKAKKNAKPQKPEEMAPLRYALGAPVRTDFDAPRGPIFSFHHGVTAPDGMPIEFYETSEHVRNKRIFRYTHCIADPSFPGLLYRHTEPEPYGPHMSFEDSAHSIFFDRTAHHVTTDKGFRTSRSNVCIREGRWFWECRVTRGIPRQLNKDGGGGGGTSGGGDVTMGAPSSVNPNNTAGNAAGATGSSGVKMAPAEARGHVRVGFSRREAPLEAPVGFDAYSYGIRDVAGQKVWLSRPKDFFPPGEDLREGDVLGLEIQLPSEQLQRKVLAGEYNPAVDAADVGPDAAAPAPNIVRDRIPIRFKGTLYFDKIEYYPTKELEDLTNPAPLVATPIPVNPGPEASSRQQRTSHPRVPASLISTIPDPPNPLHASPSLRTLPNSFIRVYRNGVLMGTAFENLLAFLPPASQPHTQHGTRSGLDDGMLGYYPAVSVFRGGAAEVNFGPRFWYPPPGYEEADDEVDMVDMLDEPMGVVDSGRPSVAASTATTTVAVTAAANGADTTEATTTISDLFSSVKPISQRFTEQIAEDVYYDILDEVDFWVRDGMPDHAGVATADKMPRIGVEAGAGLIKELVQDD